MIPGRSRKGGRYFQVAGKIYTESQRLIRLVEDIIKISQLDDEELELERTPVDLSEMVREVQSTLMPEATKHRYPDHPEERSLCRSGDTSDSRGDGLRSL